VRPDEQGLNPAPLGVPDVRPDVAELYLRQVDRLAEALNDPGDRAEAATAAGSARIRSRSNGDRCALGYDKKDGRILWWRRPGSPDPTPDDSRTLFSEV
jgi:hypothetical protein